MMSVNVNTEAIMDNYTSLHSWAARATNEARRGYAQPASEIRRAYLATPAVAPSTRMGRTAGLVEIADHVFPLSVG